MSEAPKDMLSRGTDSEGNIIPPALDRAGPVQYG
jgi:hypothetical protein